MIKTDYRITVDNGSMFKREIDDDDASSLLGELCEAWWRTIDDTGKPPTMSIERVQTFYSKGE